MSQQEIFEDIRRTREARVLEIIHKRFDNEAKAHEKLEWLGLRGLHGALDVAEAMSEEFKITISVDEAKKLFTVADVIELVHRRVEYSETEGRG